MWLAVFDGLLFPLLALDGLIVGAFYLGLLLADGELRRSHAAPVGIPLLLIIPIVLGVVALADFFITRRVWRAVNKPLDGFPTVPPAKDSSGQTLACLALFFAGLSGVLGAVTFCFWPNPPAGLVWSIPVAALLGIFLGISARTHRLGRRAIAIGGVNLAIWLVVLAAVSLRPTFQAQLASSSSAEFHCRVFEADAALVDKLIPGAQRKGVAQPDTKSNSQEGLDSGSQSIGKFSMSTHGTKLTDAQLAEISFTTLDALLNRIADKPGILVDQTSMVLSGWWQPGLADGWSYSRASDKLLGNGGATGTLGFRDRDGQAEIRINENVNHNIDLTGRGTVDLNAKLFYDGIIPPTGALAFVVPFIRKDDSTHYLVVVYEIGNATIAATPPAAAQSLSFDAFVARVRRELSRASVRFDKLHISAVNDDSFIVSFSGLEAHGMENGKDAWLPIQNMGFRNELDAQRGRFDGKWNFTGSGQLTVARFTVADLDLDKLLETNLAEGMPAAPAAAQNLSFGPVMERTLTGDTNQVSPLLCLHDGTLVFPPAQARTQSATVFADWWRGMKADLCITVIGKKLMVSSLEVGGAKFVEVPADEWKIASPTGVADTLMKGSFHQPIVSGFDDFFLPEPVVLPATFAVESRTGEKGLLQIIGFTENPPSIMIRYKLVQNSSPQIAQPIKTIILTRATNRLVGTTTDTRTVQVWSDSTLLPGEKLRVLTRLPDGETVGGDAEVFLRYKAGHAGTSTSFSWWFKEEDGFGAAEAEAATAQIRDHWTQMPLIFKSSVPREVFCVTNGHGATLAGSIEFVHTAPQPPDASGQIKATVQVKHFSDFISFPGIGFMAKVPDGYALRATSNYGEGDINSPGGGYDYNASWFPMNHGMRQPAVTALSWNLKHAPAGNDPSSWNDPSEKFEIILGQPRLIVSITNSPDDVFQGFLELVGPEAPVQHSTTDEQTRIYPN